MINEPNARSYCKDDISRIENYDIAVADTTQTWICHHRLELTIDNESAHDAKELKRLDMYYNRPYFELIFLTRAEHNTLHHAHKLVSNNTRQKLSKAKRGKVYSDFGRKFTEHFGIASFYDRKLYCKEHKFYRHHNKTCRWELKNI